MTTKDMTVTATLGAPGRIANLVLKNRFIQSPLHTMLADSTGRVTPDMLAYYRERALGGAALVISEYAFVDDKGARANVAQISVADDHAGPGLARLAETIQQAGALAGVQISHCGRQQFLGTDAAVAPSSVPWEAMYEAGAPIPRELTIPEIEEIVEAYGRAAGRVKAAGFDLVEFHAGHGYLIGQFLSQITNRRSDLYGGPLENRQRFGRDVLRAIRRAVGPDFPVTARMSAIEGQAGGITLDETIATAQLFEAEGVAAIDISAGNHHTIAVQVQPMYGELAPNAGFAAEVRRAVGIPVSVVGSITDPQVAANIVESGQADFVRLGRPLLADAAYPAKVLAGRPETVRPCIRCGECLDRGVATRRPIVCAVNFRCGRENALGIDARPAVGLRIAVVGGGPAGLEAAAAATSAGHEVTLYERDRLAGSLADIARADFKADLLRYRDYLVTRAGELADVREQEATREELERLAPDVVVLATGAMPAPRADAVDLRTAFADPGSLGSRVVIEGGGQFAAELAWMLAGDGVQVSIAAPGDVLAADVGTHSSVPIVDALDELGVHRWWGCRSVSWADGECRVVRADGSSLVEPCDTLVASDYVSRSSLADELAGGPWELIEIGDGLRPGRILDAVSQANVAVLRLATVTRAREVAA
jgi:2,4-dienoyl-CoA reductase-like NADH-dependent reductase (Old Yellow Enzyme family)